MPLSQKSKLSLAIQKADKDDVFESTSPRGSFSSSPLDLLMPQSLYNHVKPSTSQVHARTFKPDLTLSTKFEKELSDLADTDPALLELFRDSASFPKDMVDENDAPDDALISDEEPNQANLAEEEDLKDYVPGGYHPCFIGESYKNDKYTLVRKLGWGHFSTVWLARDNDMHRHVAMKIVRLAKHYTETAVDEVKLLEKVTNSEMHHPGHGHVIQLLDTFSHEGPNGVHVVMVFEVLGENLLGLIRRYKHRGIPVVFVKQIAKQLLAALDFLHRHCGVIHTDLKPENILIEIGDVEHIVRMVEQEEEHKRHQRKLQRARLRTENTTSFAINTASGPKQNLSPQVHSHPSHASLDTNILGSEPLCPNSSNTAPLTNNSLPSLGRNGRRSRQQTLITGSQPLPSPLRTFNRLFVNVYGLATTANTPIRQHSLSHYSGPHHSATPASSNGISPLAPSATSPISLVSPTNISIARSSAKFHSIDQAVGSKGPIDMPHPSIAGALRNSLSSMSLSDTNNRGDNSESLLIRNLLAVEDDSMIHDKSVLDHTRIHPENHNNDNIINEEEVISVKIADLGNACWTHHHFTDEIQTRQYRLPEVLLGYHWGALSDMWLFACLIFELLTGDYLFDPRDGKTYTKDDDHIAQLVELVGPFPRQMLQEGFYTRDFFNSRGELHRIAKLKPWPLEQVLREKYNFPSQDAHEISDFLLPMLRVLPEKRADAGGMINHQWLMDALALENVVLERPVGGSGEDILGWLKEVKVPRRSTPK